MTASSQQGLGLLQLGEEVLDIIFGYVIDDKLSAARQHARFQLGTVCSRFRSIVEAVDGHTLVIARACSLQGLDRFLQRNHVRARRVRSVLIETEEETRTQRSEQRYVHLLAIFKRLVNLERLEVSLLDRRAAGSGNAQRDSFATFLNFLKSLQSLQVSLAELIILHASDQPTSMLDRTPLLLLLDLLPHLRLLELDARLSDYEEASDDPPHQVHQQLRHVILSDPTLLIDLFYAPESFHPHCLVRLPCCPMRFASWWDNWDEDSLREIVEASFDRLDACHGLRLDALSWPDRVPGMPTMIYLGLRYFEVGSFGRVTLNDLGGFFGLFPNCETFRFTGDASRIVLHDAQGNTMRESGSLAAFFLILDLLPGKVKHFLIDNATEDLDEEQQAQLKAWVKLRGRNVRLTMTGPAAC